MGISIDHVFSMDKIMTPRGEKSVSRGQKKPPLILFTYKAQIHIEFTNG